MSNRLSNSTNKQKTAGTSWNHLHENFYSLDDEVWNEQVVQINQNKTASQTE